MPPRDKSPAHQKGQPKKPSQRWQDTIVAGFYWRQLMLFLLAGIGKGLTIPDLYQRVADYIKENHLSLAPEQKGSALSLCRGKALVHCGPQDHTDAHIRAPELLRLDLAFAYNGHFVDGARTVIVDEHGAHQLPRFRAIMARLAPGILPGSTTTAVSRTLYQELKNINYYLLPIYGGHGIGRRLHQSPRIMPLQRENESTSIAQGATLAVEFVAARQSSGIYQHEPESCHFTQEDISAIHEEDTIIVAPHGGIMVTEPLRERHWRGLGRLDPALFDLRKRQKQFFNS